MGCRFIGRLRQFGPRGGNDQAVAALVPLPALPRVGAAGLPPEARAALSRLVSRLRLRAAAFLWIVLCAAIRSSHCVVARSAVSATSMLPLVTAAVKALTLVLSTSLRAR